MHVLCCEADLQRRVFAYDSTQTHFSVAGAKRGLLERCAIARGVVTDDYVSVNRDRIVRRIGRGAQSYFRVSDRVARRAFPPDINIEVGSRGNPRRLRLARPGDANRVIHRCAAQREANVSGIVHEVDHVWTRSESTAKHFGARLVDAKLTVAQVIAAVQAADRDFRLTRRHTHCCALDGAVCNRTLRPFSASRRSIRSLALQREITGRQHGVFQNPGDVLSRHLPLIFARKFGICIIREFATHDELRMHHRDIERFDRALPRIRAKVQLRSMLEHPCLRRLDAANVVSYDSFVRIVETIEVNLRSKAREFGRQRHLSVIVVKQAVVDRQVFDLDSHRRTRRLLIPWRRRQIRTSVGFRLYENNRMIDRDAIELHLMMK